MHRTIHCGRYGGDVLAGAGLVKSPKMDWLEALATSQAREGD